MTREEREDAINCFKNKLENEVFGAKYNKLALEALEQASILDKIRSEIRLEKLGYPPSADYYQAIEKALQIIDKNKREFEEFLDD